MVMLAACSENQEKEIVPQTTIEQTGTFSFKDLTIHDVTGNYFMNIRIGANHPGLLAEFNIENYQLLINPVAETSVSDLNDISIDEDEGDEEIISTEYLRNNFDETVESYRLVYQPITDPNARPGWACKKRTYWYRSYGADKVYVKNKNGVNRFNVSVYYMRSFLSHNNFSYQGNGDIVSQIAPWTLKSNYDMKGKGDYKTTRTCVENYSYGMAVKLETKRCASKEVTFTDTHCGLES